MNELVSEVAREWIEQVEKRQKKLNKQAKQAVLSFAIWMDTVIYNEEKRKEKKHDTEN